MCGEARSCYWVSSWIIHLELDLELNDWAVLAGQWASSVPALGLQTWATHWLFPWVLWKLNSGPLHLHRKHATDWTISSQPSLFVCSCVWDRASYNPRWPHNCYVAKDNIELLIFQTLLRNHWDAGVHQYTWLYWCNFYVQFKTEQTTLLVIIYNDHMQRSIFWGDGDSSMLSFLITFF